MFGSFDFQEFLSAFIVLFAVIDIIGSIPIILNLKQKGRNVNANKATGISFALLIGFFYAGGAGAFTTLLSLRSEYAPVNIVVALILNMVWVYVVLKLTDRIERFLGKGGIYVIRKFFGIILLAISARLFTANLTLLIEQFQKAQ